jgi:hypothetical protein
MALKNEQNSHLFPRLVEYLNLYVQKYCLWHAVFNEQVHLSAFLGSRLYCNILEFTCYHLVKQMKFFFEWYLTLNKASTRWLKNVRILWKSEFLRRGKGITFYKQWHYAESLYHSSQRRWFLNLQPVQSIKSKLCGRIFTLQAYLSMEKICFNRPLGYLLPDVVGISGKISIDFLIVLAQLFSLSEWLRL